VSGRSASSTRVPSKSRKNAIERGPRNFGSDSGMETVLSFVAAAPL
jgi:hypothetical protein